MTTAMNTKGQVTIPEELRRKYGFAPGTKVVWIERDGQIILEPVLSVDQLFGILKPRPGEPSLTEELLRERRREREGEDAEWGGSSGHSSVPGPYR